MFACTEVWPEEVAGVAINQEGSLNTDAENAILFRMHTTCVESFYLWNPGQPALVLPKDIGYTVGKGTNARSFVVQIHYDNQNMVEGETDTSEIVMYHTPYKRKFDMGVFSPGSVLLNHQVLPRKTKSIYYSQRCAVWMNTSVASEVQAFIHIPHMHYAGKSVWSEVIGTDVFSDKPKLLAPGDKPFRELARMDSFDPDLQFWYPVNLTLKHGDLIATTCIFDTSDREDEVRGGLATLDEMCVNNMFFYPREAIPAVFCAGDSVDNDPPFYGIWPEGLSSVLGLDPLAEALLTPKKALRNGFPAASPFYPLIAEEDQAGRIEAEHVPAEPLEDDTQEVSSAGPIRIWAVLSIISAVVLGEILSVVILV